MADRHGGVNNSSRSDTAEGLFCGMCSSLIVISHHPSDGDASTENEDAIVCTVERWMHKTSIFRDDFLPLHNDLVCVVRE